MSSYHILESEYFKTGKKALSDGDIRDEFNRVVFKVLWRRLALENPMKMAR